MNNIVTMPFIQDKLESIFSYVIVSNFFKQEKKNLEEDRVGCLAKIPFYLTMHSY